jgi:type IV pilus assembly protein PilC
MNKYVYKARNSQGKLIEGVIQLRSSREVVAALHDKGLIAISVELVSEKVQKKKKKKTREVARRKKIKPKDIAVFCRQMATMINAGVSVVEAVDDLGGMSLNLKFKEVLQHTANDIKTGSSLSEALKSSPKVFDKVFVSMIRAGEESGHLDAVLLQIQKPFRVAWRRTAASDSNRNGYE